MLITITYGFFTVEQGGSFGLAETSSKGIGLITREKERVENNWNYM